MQIDIVRFPENVEKWYLVNNFMRFRKEVFVEKMDWPLFTADDKEFEQYDGLSAVYVIAHEDGVVCGGTRLIQTTKTIGFKGAVGYSYMLRDAFLGRLEGLPSNICDEEPPTEDNIWELTRLASNPSSLVGKDVLNAANDFLLSVGATHCLVLARPPLLRMAKSMGFNPRKLGQIRGNESGKFVAFESTVIDRNQPLQDAKC